MTHATTSFGRTLVVAGLVLATAAASASLRQAPPRSTGSEAAIEVVRRYYRAIDARDYPTAWAQWGRRGRPGQTYAAFRQGFAATRTVRLTVTGPARIEGTAGSVYVTVPVQVDAVSRARTRQRFSGEYVVGRTNVDGATAGQRQWLLYSATLKTH